MKPACCCWCWYPFIGKNSESSCRISGMLLGLVLVLVVAGTASSSTIIQAPCGQLTKITDTLTLNDTRIELADCRNASFATVIVIDGGVAAAGRPWDVVSNLTIALRNSSNVWVQVTNVQLLHCRIAASDITTTDADVAATGRCTAKAPGVIAFCAGPQLILLSNVSVTSSVVAVSGVRLTADMMALAVSPVSRDPVVSLLPIVNSVIDIRDAVVGTSSVVSKSNRLLIDSCALTNTSLTVRSSSLIATNVTAVLFTGSTLSRGSALLFDNSTMQCGGGGAPVAPLHFSSVTLDSSSVTVSGSTVQSNSLSDPTGGVMIAMYFVNVVSMRAVVTVVDSVLRGRAVTDSATTALLYWYQCSWGGGTSWNISNTSLTSFTSPKMYGALLVDSLMSAGSTLVFSSGSLSTVRPGLQLSSVSVTGGSNVLLEATRAPTCAIAMFDVTLNASSARILNSDIGAVIVSGPVLSEVSVLSLVNTRVRATNGVTFSDVSMNGNGTNLEVRGVSFSSSSLTVQRLVANGGAAVLLSGLTSVVLLVSDTAVQNQSRLVVDAVTCSAPNFVCTTVQNCTISVGSTFQVLRLVQQTVANRGSAFAVDGLTVTGGSSATFVSRGSALVCNSTWAGCVSVGNVTVSNGSTMHLLDAASVTQHGPSGAAQMVNVLITGRSSLRALTAGSRAVGGGIQMVQLSVMDSSTVVLLDNSRAQQVIVSDVTLAAGCSMSVAINGSDVVSEDPSSIPAVVVEKAVLEADATRTAQVAVLVASSASGQVQFSDSVVRGGAVLQLASAANLSTTGGVPAVHISNVTAVSNASMSVGANSSFNAPGGRCMKLVDIAMDTSVLSVGRGATWLSCNISAIDVIGLDGLAGRNVVSIGDASNVASGAVGPLGLYGIRVHASEVTVGRGLVVSVPLSTGSDQALVMVSNSGLYGCNVSLAFDVQLLAPLSGTLAAVYGGTWSSCLLDMGCGAQRVLRAPVQTYAATRLYNRGLAALFPNSLIVVAAAQLASQYVASRAALYAPSPVPLPAVSCTKICVVMYAALNQSTVLFAGTHWLSAVNTFLQLSAMTDNTLVVVSHTVADQVALYQASLTDSELDITSSTLLATSGGDAALQIIQTTIIGCNFLLTNTVLQTAPVAMQAAHATTAGIVFDYQSTLQRSFLQLAGCTVNVSGDVVYSDGLFISTEVVLRDCTVVSVFAGSAVWITSSAELQGYNGVMLLNTTAATARASIVLAPLMTLAASLNVTAVRCAFRSSTTGSWMVLSPFQPPSTRLSAAVAVSCLHSVFNSTMAGALGGASGDAWLSIDHASLPRGTVEVSVANVTALSPSALLLNGTVCGSFSIAVNDSRFLLLSSNSSSVPAVRCVDASVVSSSVAGALALWGVTLQRVDAASGAPLLAVNALPANAIGVEAAAVAPGSGLSSGVSLLLDACRFIGFHRLAGPATAAQLQRGGFASAALQLTLRCTWWQADPSKSPRFVRGGELRGLATTPVVLESSTHDPLLVCPWDRGVVQSPSTTLSVAATNSASIAPIPTPSPSSTTRPSSSLRHSKNATHYITTTRADTKTIAVRSASSTMSLSAARKKEGFSVTWHRHTLTTVTTSASLMLPVKYPVAGDDGTTVQSAATTQTTASMMTAASAVSLGAAVGGIGAGTATDVAVYAALSLMPCSTGRAWDDRGGGEGLQRYVLSPLYDAGPAAALWGNVGIVLAVVAFHFGVCRLLQRRLRLKKGLSASAAEQRAAMTVRFPSISHSIVVLMLPGTLFAAGAVMNVNTAGVVVAAAVTAVLVVVTLRVAVRPQQAQHWRVSPPSPCACRW